MHANGQRKKNIDWVSRQNIFKKTLKKNKEITIA